MLATPTSHRIQTNVLGFVIRSLGGCVDSRVGNSTGSKSKRLHHFTLWLSNAHDRSRINQDVAWPAATELNLGSLLVAPSHLETIAWSSRVLANWAFASKVAKVPDSICLTPDHVIMTIRLPRQFERVLATEEEGRLVFRVQVLAVFGSRSRKRLPTVGSWTSWLRS